MPQDRAAAPARVPERLVERIKVQALRDILAQVIAEFEADVQRVIRGDGIGLHPYLSRQLGAQHAIDPGGVHHQAAACFQQLAVSGGPHTNDRAVLQDWLQHLHPIQDLAARLPRQAVHPLCERRLVHHVEGIVDLVRNLQVRRPGQPARIMPQQLVAARMLQSKLVKANLVHVKDVDGLSHLVQRQSLQHKGPEPGLPQPPGKIAPARARPNYNRIGLQQIRHRVSSPISIFRQYSTSQAG